MRRVAFDPDGTGQSYLGVIIQHASGVLYCQQCGGTATEQREAEGYFVPLGGLRFRPEDGLIAFSDLTAVFHRGRECLWGKLSSDQLLRLSSVVESIPYWDARGIARISIWTTVGSARF